MRDTLGDPIDVATACLAQLRAKIEGLEADLVYLEERGRALEAAVTSHLETMWKIIDPENPHRLDVGCMHGKANCPYCKYMDALVELKKVLENSSTRSATT